MLYWLILIGETVASCAVVVLTALWSVPAAVIIGILLSMGILFARPALRTERILAERCRYVLHSGRPPRLEERIPVRPSDLSSGEVARLFEGAGLLGERNARRGAISAMLLDLDRRGVMRIRIEQNEAVLVLPAQPIVGELEPYEKELVWMFGRAAKGAEQIRLRAFCEYAARHIRTAQHALDRIDRALTAQLVRRGLFARKKRDRRFVLVLTPRGTEQAALWRAYYWYLCNAPMREDIDPAYPASFCAQIEQFLIEAEAVGLFCTVRDRILLEYLFEPSSLWQKERVYAGLAAADSPFRTQLYEVVHLLLTYGTSHYHGDDWQLTQPEV